LFVVDDFLYPNGLMAERRSAFEFDHIFHQVRHPLATIASCIEHMGRKPHFWHWTQVHTGLRLEAEGRLSYAAKFWLAWQERMEKQRPEWRFHVESDFWPELCDRLKMTDIPHLPVADRKASEHADLCWDDLGVLEDPIRAVAFRYGYET
jgi:hypothetical protein